MRRGGRLAAEHLLNLGHRRLAHLMGPPLPSTSRKRRAGFVAAVEAAGLVPLVSSPASDFQAGGDAAESLLAANPRPTAIFAANDYLALGACRAAERAGLRVPEDLSVLGFSDLSFARSVGPPLSTFAHDPQRIGGNAVEMLLERLDAPGDPDEPAEPRRRLVAPRLIVRHSAAPPVSS